MYKIEIDNNNVIRGKCFVQGSVDDIIALGFTGLFVSDEVGGPIELPADPVYDAGGNLIGGTHRPDLVPVPVSAMPTSEERLSAIEDAISALMGV